MRTPLPLLRTYAQAASQQPLMVSQPLIVSQPSTLSSQATLPSQLGIVPTSLYLASASPSQPPPRPVRFLYVANVARQPYQQVRELLRQRGVTTARIHNVSFIGQQGLCAFTIDADAATSIAAACEQIGWHPLPDDFDYLGLRDPQATPNIVERRLADMRTRIQRSIDTTNDPAARDFLANYRDNKLQEAATTLRRTMYANPPTSLSGAAASGPVQC